MKKLIPFVIACVLVLIGVCIRFLGPVANTASVGIIGGADGPTAIFIASRPGAGLGAIGISICILLIITGVLLAIGMKRRREKK